MPDDLDATAAWEIPCAFKRGFIHLREMLGGFWFQRDVHGDHNILIDPAPLPCDFCSAAISAVRLHAPPGALSNHERRG
jgi:hypothetical protein